MAIRPRYLQTAVQQDALADEKMAFISGPRQVGKTTLARAFLQDARHNYFTWDDAAFRRAFARNPLQAVEGRGPGPIVLDEIHKDRRWKWRLKGLYDQRGDTLPIVVTGSARLDLYRRGGDSLMGRYIPYHLHPMTVAESAISCSPDEAHTRSRRQFKWEDLMALGGFPEPLLAGHRAKALRWSDLRKERLLAEDVRDMRAVSDLSALRVLLDLLPETVGSLLSINALREDIGVAHGTVRGWLTTLEALYHCFWVPPYTRRVRRAVRLASKLYLFDVLQIPSTAARQENLAALHLVKAVQFWNETAQGRFALHYVRDKEQREVDFLLLRDGKPWWLVECKSDDSTPSPALLHFSRQLGMPQSFQLTTRKNHDRRYSEFNLRVLPYETFFAGML